MCRVELHLFKKRALVPWALFSIASPRSFNLGRYDVPEFRQKVIAFAREGRYDVVEVALSTAGYGLDIRRELGTPVVQRVHNVHWVNIDRMNSASKNPVARLFLRNETRKTRREEVELAVQVDLNLTVSDHDAEMLRKDDARIRCVTIPAGVALSGSHVEHGKEEPRSILWMGSLGWPPNQDSFWWFYREIFPDLVRRDSRVRLVVAGSNPPEDILNIRQHNVEILGYVEDLRSVIRRCQVCVVPLRIGSGIRLKLLEMFAERRAVVSTSIGCEGMGVEDGTHLLIADDPAGFAGAVLRLLDDDQLRAALGDRARRHVELLYDWEKIAVQYEDAYRSVVGPGAGGREALLR